MIIQNNFGRNINHELTKCYNPKFMSLKDRQALHRTQRALAVKNKQQNAYFRCPECQILLPGDNAQLQKHMLDVHVRDRAKNKMKAWKFTPEREGRNTRVI